MLTAMNPAQTDLLTGTDPEAADPAGEEAAPAPTPSPDPEPEPQPEEIISTADDVREGLSEQSEAVGSVADTLDAIALAWGDLRISLWDVTIVAAVIAIVLGIAWVMTRVMRYALKRATKLDSSRRLLVEKIATVLIWIGAFLLAVDMLGIDLTALAVFSGAFGLAIGFGLQKTFGNLIAGIILLMDRSIKPGDVIAIADQAGNETFGQIRKIGIRAVSVTTRDEREYLIPNENLMINQVENWSYSSRKVRMQVPVGVAYSCDMKLAQELMLEAADSCKRVLPTPKPTVWMSEYGDSSVNFIIHCWITDPEMGVGNVRSEVLNALWDLFQEHGIEIPFPQRDLNLRDSEQVQQLIAAISQRVEEKTRRT